MKYLLTVSLAWWLFGCTGTAQDSPKRVTLIQLMGAPGKFDGQRVTVWGFLRIHRQPKHGVSVVLYLHREDSENLLGNSILVIPSKQMLKDEEKLDHMYVILRGTFRAVPAAGGG